MTDRPNLADRLPEPEDGATLVVENHFREFTPIIRDDQSAKEGDCDATGGERWFVATDEPEAPETWRDILVEAVRVHSLTTLAEFEPANG